MIPLCYMIGVEKYFISDINPVLCLSYKLYCMICMLPYLANKRIHYMPGKQHTTLILKFI